MTSAAATTQAYRQGAVAAASPAGLVVMLYDGARRFLRRGAAAMRERQIEAAHISLRRGELILAHLDDTLDYEQGGEIAERLHTIYMYCLRHLNAARLAQDPAMVEEVDAMLAELQAAWVEIAAGRAG